MKLFKTIIISLIALVGVSNLYAQKAQEYLTPTPPMGWNSWNYFMANISEDVIKKVADAMVSSGLRDAGYKYIVIDDIWEYGRVKRSYKEVVERDGRDANGRLIANPETFPSGMKALADYIHAKGLKFGIYTAPGVGTCYGCTGSFGYEAIDLKTFAEWGVDYIKLDQCFATEPNEIILKRWRNIIDSIGRPIVLSVNMGNDFGMAKKYADMWRTTNDIWAVWRFKPEEFIIGEDIFGILDKQVGLEKFHGNGSWNDPDMLQVGNGYLTYNENKCHFGMWAVLGAPLILGNNLYEMKDSIRDILANREVIAINQDPAGVMATKLYDNGLGQQIWVKQLWKVGDQAVAFLNASDNETEISVNLTDIGIKGQAFFRDAFEHKDLGLFSNKFSVTLNKNSMLLAKVSAFEKLQPIQPYMQKLLQFDGNPVRLEAENSKYTASKTDDKLYKKFSGKAYLLSQNHEWATFGCNWNFGIAQAGKYSLSIRYINSSAKVLVYKINENTPNEQTIQLKPSTKKLEWKNISFEMNFAKGNNFLKITAPDSKSNNFAIDYIELLPIK